MEEGRQEGRRQGEAAVARPTWRPGWPSTAAEAQALAGQPATAPGHGGFETRLSCLRFIHAINRPAAHRRLGCLDLMRLS